MRSRSCLGAAWCVVSWCVVASALPCAAQPPAGPAPRPVVPDQIERPPLPAVEAPGPSVAIVSRADLAERYLRVDRLFMTLIGDGPRRVGTEKVAQFNRDFDAITGMFFTGNFPAAVAKLEELAQEMMTTGGGEVPPSIGTSIAATVEPSVWWPGSAATPRVRVRSFWTSAIDGKVTVELRWDDGRASAEGHPSLVREIELVKGRAVELDVPLADFGAWPEGGEHWAPKQYTVRVSVRGYREEATARYAVVPRSLDIARKDHEKRLAGALGAHPELANQIALCRARSRVLVDYPGTLDPAEFLADYPALLAQVEGEVAALAEGRNPYVRRTGEVYRPIVGKGMPNGEPVACLVYAPSKAAGDEPLPVIVALHGAGGDESMFVRGYGAGRLAQLAEEKGFILASVQSYRIGGRAQILDVLIDQLARDYAVDRSRVYVMGHSLGAGAATYLANARPDSVAAAVCFAGYGKAGARCAPTRVYTGGLDAIVPAASVSAGVKEAQSRNLPVELREDPNCGHTLLVGAKLDEAVAWLLGQSLRSAPGT